MNFDRPHFSKHLVATLFLASSTVLAQPVPLQTGSPIPAAPGLHSLEAAEFAPNLEALRNGAGELLVLLPEGGQLVLERTGYEDRGDGDLLWRGRVVAIDSSIVVLTVKGGLLAGVIQSPRHDYRIVLREGREVLERHDRSRRQLIDEGIQRPSKVPSGPAEAAAEVQPAIVPVEGEAEIDVLVLYTPPARDAAGGAAAMEASIQAMVDYANTVFLNSNVAAHYRLLFTRDTSLGALGQSFRPYGDPDPGTNVEHMRQDGVLAALRTAAGADMVVLIVKEISGPVCGYAQTDYTPSLANSFQSTGFFDGCLPGETFAHESGHLLGMAHDPVTFEQVDIARGGAPPPFPWSYGHFVTGVFGTIMSYFTPTIPYFSNPDISYQGHPTGIANQRDNARTGRINAPLMAALRSPGPLTVPPAPTGLNPVAGLGIGGVLQVTTVWFPASGASSYEVERSVDGVNFTRIGTPDTNNFSDTGVSTGATYHYRVRGVNFRGPGPYSDPRTIVMPVPPSAPTNLTAVAEGASEIRLNWTDTSTGEVAFVIEMDYFGVWEPVDETGPNATSYIFRFGQPSTQYRFRIYARTDILESGRSNEAPATTLASNPGKVTGYAFNDPNRNSRPDAGETPAAGLVIYYDANGNGISDDAGAPPVTVTSAASVYPGTNLPYVRSPNYALSNLPTGSRRICASFKPTQAGQSFCRTVLIQASTQNVNFPVIEGRVGASSMTPAAQTVRSGDKVTVNVTWSHTDGKWVLLKDAVIRFAEVIAPGGRIPDDALQIQFEESTREFRLYRDLLDRTGFSYPAGSKRVLQTEDASFHLEDTQVIGSGPTGPSVTLKLVVSFKPRSRGKTFSVQIQLTDDNGYVQGYDPLGTVTVVR